MAFFFYTLADPLVVIFIDKHVELDKKHQHSFDSDSSAIPDNHSEFSAISHLAQTPYNSGRYSAPP